MKALRGAILVLAVLAVGILVFGTTFTLGEQPGDKMVQVFKKDVRPPEDLLPEDVKVAEGFEPGEGDSVGTIEMVVNDGLVFHKGEKAAYRAKKGYELFEGDTLITGERSRMQIRLKDRSVMGLAPWSKMVLDRSQYDPKKDRRSTFLSFLFGKARFIVSKLKAAYDDDFQVKTSNAVCGLRGSDFAISVVPKGEETSLLRPGWFARLSLVSEANAQLAGIPVTVTFMTAEGTTISVQGVIVPAFNATVATAPGVVAIPVAVTPAVAAGVMSTVAPQLAILEMPPDME